MKLDSKTTLESNNCFTRHRADADKTEGVFSGHHFAPIATYGEGNVWGVLYGKNTFEKCFQKVLSGKEFCIEPFDRKVVNETIVSEKRAESIGLTEDSKILCADSQSLKLEQTDLVITDPPYGGNVNYSELADFFYVWLRSLLSQRYQYFSPEVTAKSDEIVENPTRGKSSHDYEEGLTAVWANCHKQLSDDGLMAFTFHHSEGDTWEALLDSLCNAGFVVEAIYPIHGESESSLHLQDKQAISYDLIHVCKKRAKENSKKRSWAGIRQEIRRKAREEIRLIESGRYGEGQLSAADTNITLIGKCLELYSKHYGNIVDYKDEVVPLSDALASIRLMAEMLVNTQNPLPSELENIDPISYVYLTCLCDRKEIKSDEVHKATRGIIEPDVLFKAGVIRKGRAKRGRTYEVKLPDERLKDLEKIFGKKDKYAGGQAFLFPELEQEWFDNIRLVDAAHYLMALAITGKNITPWLRIFKPVIVPVRVAMEYMMQRNPTFQEPIQKVINLIEV